MRLAVIDPPSISTPSLQVELTFKTLLVFQVQHSNPFPSPLSPQILFPRKILLRCSILCIIPYCSNPPMEWSPYTLSRLAGSSLIPVPHTAHSPQLDNAHPTLLHLHNHTQRCLFLVTAGLTSPWIACASISKSKIFRLPFFLLLLHPLSLLSDMAIFCITHVLFVATFYF